MLLPGKTCSVLDYCASQPCKNGATCVNTHKGDFMCTCAPGFKGMTCAEDLDECSANASLCLNRGVCRNTFGSYRLASIALLTLVVSVDALIVYATEFCPAPPVFNVCQSSVYCFNHSNRLLLFLSYNYRTFMIFISSSFFLSYFLHQSRQHTGACFYSGCYGQQTVAFIPVAIVHQ